MIYPSDLESKIGFSSLKSILSSKCNGSAGKTLVDHLAFSSDFPTIKTLLSQTAEMKSILESNEELPNPLFLDIEPSLSRIRTEGSFMETKNLQRLHKMLLAFKDVRSFYCKNNPETNSPKYPFLHEVFSPLMEFPYLCSIIEKSINRFGEVADNASEGLLKVRTALAIANNAVAKAMRRALEKAASNGIIDKDVTPAIRDGRMVIPVEAGKKRSLNGIIHDESASGKTVFIEPAEVVEVSNRVRELEMEERREVIAVLINIASIIRPHIDDILLSNNIISNLDLISAKALLAVELGGNMPQLSDKPEIEWYGAVHPILFLTLKNQNKSVVPLNIKLDESSRFLIVSGPNAGGKSVVLKTVAIVQYMTQCGLLPPVFDNSRMGIFKNLFVDIGDQQSIENDLSTYSSHLKNMKFFLSHASSDSIVLIDEIGSGTEPMIGSALAQSILNKLGKTNCYGIATTHFQNLKSFADNTPGFVNGAMVYDRHLMQPAFQLSIGNPGSSFALEIAKKIGLPGDIIEDAKSIVGSDYVNLDKYLLDIERDRRYWNNKRLNIKEKEHKLNQLLAKYEETSADLKSQRQQIINDAKIHAREILDGANAKIEATIRGIRDAQAEKERTKSIRRELTEYKESINNAENEQPTLLKPLKHKSRIKNKPAQTISQPKEFIPKVGDYVKMDDSSTPGEILSISGKKAEVAFGSLRTFVSINKLKPSAKPKKSAFSLASTLSASTFDDSRSRQLNFKPEIDVRGMRADEALQAVTYFIDDAIQFSAERLRILHGTGHGILRTLIREQLKINPFVKDYFDEDVRFGGAGITIVDLSPI